MFQNCSPTWKTTPPHDVLDVRMVDARALGQRPQRRCGPTGRSGDELATHEVAKVTGSVQVGAG
jgi:hypothetical protein